MQTATTVRLTRPRPPLRFCVNDTAGTCFNAAGPYPAPASPAASFANLAGTASPEVAVNGRDGYIYLIDGSNGGVKWRQSYMHTVTGKAIEASEPIMADLNKDGVPEIVIVTAGPPSTVNTSVRLPSV